MKEQGKSKSLEIVEEQRARVVSKIIADMERGGLRWMEPYLPSLSPRNPVSGTVYQGGNRLHLGFIGHERGFADNRWCTFNQIRDSGWHLKKGSKAAIIEKWREFTVREENEDTGEKEVKGHYLRCVGYWNVFNAEEIEGIPAQPETVHLTDRTSEIADDLILSSRCPIVESPRYQGSAAYAPHADRILLAPRETFRSDESFTRVLLHEMTHSTGHPSALDRGCNTDFGSPEYAQEELVAELGSLFLSADLGIQTADYEGDFYENHVAYLQSWMRALEDDPSCLFKAAAKADKADSLIMGRYTDALSKRREQDLDRAPEKVSLKGECKAMSDAVKSHGEQAPQVCKTAGER